MTLGVNPSSGLAAYPLSTWSGEPVSADPAGKLPQAGRTSTSPWSGEPFYNPFLAQLQPAGGPVVAAAGDTSFDAEVRGQASRPIDLQLAEICKSVTDPDDAGPAGWNRVDSQVLMSQGIDPAALEDPATGFRAGIFTDGDGRYVLAFSGSNDGQDWLNNLAQGQGLPAAQYAQAVQLASQAQAAFGQDGNLVITGHSLGGGLAAIASAETGAAAVTFNAAGVHDDTLRAFGMDPDTVKQEAEDGQIRAYSVDGEFLSSLQDHRGVVLGVLTAGGVLASMINPFLGGPVAAEGIRALANGDIPKALGHRVTIDDPHPLDKPDTHWYDWLWGNAEYQELKYKAQQVKHAIDEHGIGTVIDGLRADHPDW